MNSLYFVRADKCHSLSALFCGLHEAIWLGGGCALKTTVLGVRLTDYQREKLKGFSVDGLEADTVRLLIDALITGKIVIEDGKVVSLAGLKKDADKRGCKVQVLINAILEQLSE